MKRESVITCSELTISYGDEIIIDRVSLSVERGSLIPFIGPNGAGKTTILRAFLGLVPKRSGSIVCRFGGFPPGYVPQHKQIDPLYPVSLKRIVTMGLYPELGLWRFPDSGQRERINMTLERFNLQDHQRKTFAELSGGMRQKTLIARAFISRAEVIILDEPTAGLDAASERDVLHHLHKMNRKEGKTILLAHHRLEDLSHLAPTVCLIDRGSAEFLPAGSAWEKMMAGNQGVKHHAVY